MKPSVPPGQMDAELCPDSLTQSSKHRADRGKELTALLPCNVVPVTSTFKSNISPPFFSKVTHCHCFPRTFPFHSAKNTLRMFMEVFGSPGFRDG